MAQGVTHNHMQKYKEKDLLRTAKRINNNKRPYLLVNPLQAKHVPVSPSKALLMMKSLGELVAEKHGEARLVIGFAETATAIGAAVAKAISDDCFYIHTTRENVKVADGYAFFTEEHSHATEQKLVVNKLERLFGQTETVVLVDDEFSTGKTLINMVRRLKADFPVLNEKNIVAASIINRLSTDNLDRWQEEGIESVCILKLPEKDYSPLVESISVSEAENHIGENLIGDISESVIVRSLPDPRLGVLISDYYKGCHESLSCIKAICELKDKEVLVLGTEECMLPALLLGKEIEDSQEVKSVRCHATTRSPIGICKEQGYPIRNGYHLHSFYDLERDTFIYNLQRYDVVIIVSDTRTPNTVAMKELSEILLDYGCEEILILVGDDNV